MDDDVRRTWAGVLATIGVIMLAAFVLRYWSWHHATPRAEPRPEVLWTLGSLALGLLLAAATVALRVWEWRMYPRPKPEDDWR
jgi:uncharacterized membrane protein YidH (DUF202 family)